MSWIARSLVNTLRGEEEQQRQQDEDDDPQSNQDPNKNRNQENEEEEDDDGDEDPTRGVKEDLSELTKTLTRQFWGVASFLAPPPPGESSPSDPGQRPEEEADGDGLSGIRSDFAEIGGRFKSGISMLSNAKAVTEISKIASTFLQEISSKEEEEEVEESEEGEGSYEGGAVGVTEEVVAFARNVSMHPETWLDFPLIPDEDDSDEFDMSDAQQEHALAVERLAPRLAALRIELCPSHMSEGRFWKIYFVLLHSRLNRPDAELLSTPQIVHARAILLQDLQHRRKPNSEGSGEGSTSLTKEVDESVPSEMSAIAETSADTSSMKTPTDEVSTSVPITDVETEKHPVETTELKIIDKSVIEEDSPVQVKSKDITSDASNTILVQKYEEDGDDWLKEEDGGEIGEVSGSKGTTVPLDNDEDVTFSDLEEEDDDQGTSSKNSKTINRDAAKGGNSSSQKNKGSSDWLSIDDIDEV